MSQEGESYRLLFNKFPHAIARHRIILDNEGNPVDYEFIDVNASFEEMVGLKKETIIGQKGSELPELLIFSSDWISISGRVALTGESIYFEHYFRPTGRHYKITVYSDEPGFFAAIFNVISEYKKSKRHFVTDENLLQSVFDTIQDGISVLNKNMEIQKVNQTLERWYGHNMPFTGKKCYQVYQNYQEPCESCPSIKAMEEKTMQFQIKPFTGEKGQVGWLELYSYPLTDDRGSITGVVEFVRDITERKQAEQEIKDGHQRLLTVLENVEALIYVADMETYEILFINQYGKNIFGDVVGRKCWQVLQESQSGPCEFCTNDNLLDANGQPTGAYKWEYKNTKNDRWYDCRDIALRWVDGRMVRIEMSSDITDRKQAQEEELKVYEQIVSSSNDLMSLIDREYRYRIVNKNYTIRLNLEKEEIIGRHVSEIMGAGVFHNTIKPTLDRCFAGETVNYAAWFDFSGKSRRYMDVTYSPCYSSETSNIIGAAVVSRDITERKQTEDALNESKKKLQDSEENYRLLADNTPDHIYSLDREICYTFMNQSACRALGLEAHEIIGKNVSEVGLPGEVVRQMEELFHEVLNTGKDSEIEITSLMPDGTVRTYEVVVIPVFDEKGSVTSITGTSRDISERKKLEQEIFKADKLESIGTLAGGIAHDFNNYLAVFLGNISLAKCYKDDPQKVLEKLEKMEQATLRVKDLSNQLFTFAKGAAPVKKTVSMNKSIVDNVKFILSGSNVVCNFIIDKNLLMVEIDEGQFSQVLNNIVINALQAMPEGGEMSLTAENVTIKAYSHTSFLPEGSYVKITIQDEGIGIPKKFLNKVFDPFFTTKQKGSGLGLATSYSIIKNHGGYLSAESEIGVGTTFYIYLPASTGASKPAPAADKISYGTGKILVMDDQEDFLQVAEEILTTIGYDVSLARDGGEAMESYMDALNKGCPFDLVIMDLTVPGGMGGKGTITELLKKDPAVKAIVSSGYSKDSIMANFRDYGFKGAIKKPFSIEELSQVICEIIK